LTNYPKMTRKLPYRRDRRRQNQTWCVPPPTNQLTGRDTFDW
jgi:hypothetical protein